MLALLGTITLAAVALPSATPPAIDAAAAAAAFAQAHALCTKDGGRLWGVSLCGPMMFVDARTHQAVANEPVSGGVKDGGVYRFALPLDAGIANTTVDFKGRRWVQIVWPLPSDAAKRGDLLMHESFHRVQRELHLETSGGLGQNAHLDTEMGRVFLRGEIHALRSALLAPSRAARIVALRDAIEMRMYRRSLFADAAREEQALEIQEGLAESTGIDAGVPAADRTRFAVGDLSMVENAQSYVREFPYGTGPAYAELLDAAQPAWRRHVTAKSDLALFAARASGFIPPHVSKAAAYNALRRNGGAQILAQEKTRAVTIAARDRKYAGEFLSGPTLAIPLGRFQITFDPRDVEQFAGHGSVYHKLHLSGAWGVLDVTGGDALITSDFKTAIVAVPETALNETKTLSGTGWRLQIGSGYAISQDGAGARKLQLLPHTPR